MNWQSRVVGQYKLEETIGQGAFSNVYKARRADNSVVAIKEIRRDISMKDQQLVQNQVDILNKIKHQYIVKLFEELTIDGKHYLVFQYCSKGDLNKYLKEQGTLEQQSVQVIAWCLCSALAQLHKNQIVHRDLKLANVLISDDDTVRLADFGFSKESDEELMRTHCGTPITMAPEILQHLNYRKENADTWSMGIITYQMIFGCPPWMPTSQFGMGGLARAIRTKELSFNPNMEISNSGKDFIIRCLNKDIRTRPSIKQLLNHPWIEHGHKLVLSGHGMFSSQLEAVQIPSISSLPSVEESQQREEIELLCKQCLQQLYNNHLAQCSLMNPKSFMKTVNDLFPDEEMSRLLPLILLDMIRKLKLASAVFNINRRALKIKIADVKQFNKAISSIATSLRKSVNANDFNQESMDLAHKLLLFVVQKTIQTLEQVQPQEIIQEKLKILLRLLNVSLSFEGDFIVDIKAITESQELLTKIQRVTTEGLRTRINESKGFSGDFKNNFKISSRYEASDKQNEALQLIIEQNIKANQD